MSIKKLLIVDDDKLILSILKEKINLIDDIEIITALTYKEGVKRIIENDENIHAAIIDLNLPDAPNGEMADYTIKKSIPTVVLTGIFDEDIKDRLLNNDILDYIYKDGKRGINNAINSVKRILNNYDTNALIVSDSKMNRQILKDILESIKLNVEIAKDGQEALDIIKDENKNISLILTDYVLPKINGMQLTIEIRELYDKDELGIIVLSSHNEEDISTKFIKIGANDYIDKPYKKTAVITRVNSILHTLDLFQQAKDLSFKDYMTGAYNRRYFYSSGQAIFDKAKREKEDIAIATIDIDKFKSINDTYGHDVGDLCIIKVVELLKGKLRSSDLIVRFGGEEFIVLLENISIEDIEELFENIRIQFEENTITYDEKTINFTVSIGICYGTKENIDDMVKISDEALYYCKENGRNQILTKKE